MQRINSTNRAANKFGAGKDGFQGGSPATGVKATYVTPEWTNAVQEELARAIEGAGIALDADKYDQLLAAIKSIAWGAGKTESPWAPLASPTLAGVPTADTAPDGTNTKQLATTAFVQSAVGGYISIVSMGGTIVLTEAQASNSVIGFGGGLTSDLTVVVPDSVRRQWAIANWTSGNYKLIVKTASGNGVTVAQSKRNLVYSNGQHVYDAFNDFENISLSGVSTAPTASTGTRSTQLATTAFVGAECQIAAPTGAVYTFAGATVPTGWLKCNGALLSRTVYTALFAVIGTTYGAGDGSTTFALPDLRGEFVRGADDGRGVDAGRVFGSAQSDAVQAWTATMTLQRAQVNSTEAIGGAISMGATGGGSAGPGTTWATGVMTIGPGVNSTARTAAESRPRNVAMHYIIKY